MLIGQQAIRLHTGVCVPSMMVLLNYVIGTSLALEENYQLGCVKLIVLWWLGMFLLSTLVAMREIRFQAWVLQSSETKVRELCLIC